MMTRVFKPLYTSSLARRPLGLILPMTYLNMLLVRRRGTLSTTANSTPHADARASAVLCMRLRARAGGRGR